MHNNDMPMKPVDIDAVLNGYFERKQTAAAQPAAAIDYGLLCRYAAGDIDAAERTQAEQLVAGDPSIAELVSCLRDATQAEAPAPLPFGARKAPFVLARLWHFPSMQLVRCAAVLLVLAGVTALFWSRSPGKTTLDNTQPLIAEIRTRGIQTEATNQPPPAATNNVHGAHAAGSNGISTNR